ncbi:hypothetical protein L1987_88462 [Smallanthus sonchifolius]|nr:hypothetical protein L1987_88462 [Smallanthus sonchifolius]
MNRGEPPDDLSKIRGEILNSDDPFTLPRTDTCTECSYGKVDSWVWNLGGCSEKSFLSHPLRGVRTHLRGLQVTVTRMVGKLTVPDDIQGWMGDQKRSFIFPPSSALAAFLNKPSSLLCAAFLIEAAGLTPKAEFYARERCNNNWAMRDFFKYCKRKGLLIELGGEAILVIRSERGLARSTTIAARSTVEFYGHSGSPSEDDSHTILARAGEASTRQLTSIGPGDEPILCDEGWMQRGEGDGWRSLADQFGQLSLTDQLYYRKKKEVDRNEIRLAAIFDSDLILGEEVDWEAKADPSTSTASHDSQLRVAKCGEASPHQAASIAKCSATKQALPNTTDAEVGKPEVPKEVGGRK